MILSNTAETEAFGALLARQLRAHDIITLTGTLGAGKTTLVRGLLRGLGYEGQVVSPSFALVIPYDCPDVTLPLLHADLYRLKEGEDITELGLEDALECGALLIEWPERLTADTFPEALKLQLDVIDERTRRLTGRGSAAWEGRWPLPI